VEASWKEALRAHRLRKERIADENIPDLIFRDRLTIDFAIAIKTCVTLKP